MRQLMSHTIRPCYLIEGLNGYQYRITLVQYRGARSLTDDLIPGQVVVSSRVAFILRSVKTCALIERFVLPICIYTIN
ncbi:Uncharacterized protein BM_BM13153 [Brugia malayi]|uniref:Bm13153, isoform c n=1 Tax=Brugia malayi TaxID=6279 RepID=A0A4E9F8K7_BRUMA|nr:Uncharacterized protein BM_BM13153 [Brugia malayi]